MLKPNKQEIKVVRRRKPINGKRYAVQVAGKTFDLYSSQNDANRAKEYLESGCAI